MRKQTWLGAIGLGLAALFMAAIFFAMPPQDPDAAALAVERAARLDAYRRGQALPQAVDTSEPLEARLARAGYKLGEPIFVRIFKREFEFEVWMRRDGAFSLFATYPICYFSGQLGPKMRTGDRQSPEGIYRIEARQLNPASRWHRAFNLGFPNAYDRAHGRTGNYLMVHGGCSSIGCYAMTNPAIDDLYRLAKAAFAAGSRDFQVQALPFRMTDAALAARVNHPQHAFWSELKVIADAFDSRRVPPAVAVCGGHYRLARGKSQQTAGVRETCSTTNS